MNFFTIKTQFYKSENFVLVQGDCIELMKKIPSESIDLIITDPPYFLSNNGITCQSGKMVSVNKGDWDKVNSINEVDLFNELWLIECQRVLSKNGSIWVFGTNHNIFSVGHTIQKLNFKILNTITWVKTSPPPNLSCRMFTHSTETIIWSKKNSKSKHYFNYSLMKELNGGKQMKDVWIFGITKKIEKRHGKHITQKPEEIIERIVLCSSQKGDVILDLFSGSGTTGVVSVRNDRRYIGIEIDEEYLQISKKRILDEVKN
jgi:site-specific DNA-methyltransferase (adenine-specific)